MTNRKLNVIEAMEVMRNGGRVECNGDFYFYPGMGPYIYYTRDPNYIWRVGEPFREDVREVNNDVAYFIQTEFNEVA